MEKSRIPLFMDDPNWAAFIPEMKSDPRRCSLPAHEDCSPVDPDAAARHLEPGGALGAMPGYEPRAGQLDVLRAVMRAYNGRDHLMIEAGTGVGKSLAYLVPSVLWSSVNDTPTIISTATRNLQSQLIAKDLPRAVGVLDPEDRRRFRATALKGRANYLCLRSLDEYMRNGWYALPEAEREIFAKFLDWLHSTPDGDLDSAGAELIRGRMSCPGEDCSGRQCKFYGRCFVQKARQRALRAHLIVANHSLVLSEAAGDVNGLLPAYGRIVFDEAHNLEDVATDLFTKDFSHKSLNALLGKLARKGKSRSRERLRGVLGAVERQLRKGDLRNCAFAPEVSELAKRAEVQISFVKAAADAALEELGRMLAPARGGGPLRFRRKPNRQYSAHGMFADYRDGQWNEAQMLDALKAFEAAFAELQNISMRLSQTIQRANGDDLPLYGDLAMSVCSVAQEMNGYLQDVKFAVAGESDEYVYWIERSDEPRKDGGGRGGKALRGGVRVAAAPLSVAKNLYECFHKTKDSVVFCSATLRTGDKFDYMAKKLGMSLSERCRMLVAQSPFNYLSQTLTLAADFLPDPSSGGEEYVAKFGELAGAVFAATQGRGLVLFTSYDMMRKTAEAVRGAFTDCGIRLLVQGDGVSREEMTAQLKSAAGPLVLFGAQSFWEGVDVPGAALSCVVLARLPFPQVGEPIVEARCDRIVADGGTSFRDYMLPEALIRFRQGFGRLVRTRSDRGVVLIADPRAVSKNYGALFRKSIPASVHTVKSLDETVARVREFFADDAAAR